MTVAQSCPTLCDPIDCSPPGSSVHEIFQARILEWLPFPPPGALYDPGVKLASDVSSALQAILHHWATRKALTKVTWKKSGSFFWKAGSEILSLVRRPHWRQRGYMEVSVRNDELPAAPHSSLFPLILSRNQSHKLPCKTISLTSWLTSLRENIYK